MIINWAVDVALQSHVELVLISARLCHCYAVCLCSRVTVPWINIHKSKHHMEDLQLRGDYKRLGLHYSSACWNPEPKKLLY